MWSNWGVLDWGHDSAIFRRSPWRWRRPGSRFEPKNPVTHLMSDTTTGTLQEDVLNEKVLSAIIECRAEADCAPRILAALRRVAGEIETVLSAGLAARCGPNGSVPYAEVARASGYTLSLNAKTNLGLGRPLFEERSGAAQALGGEG